ncbi:synaptonemal complex protein 3-like [Babylonia areolata]|uniref:synaptonemal complex protein 3-like n=1 Tax=Babylonia areolata TaxID=304850 RepID=UPI003FD31ECB
MGLHGDFPSASSASKATLKGILDNDFNMESGDMEETTDVYNKRWEYQPKELLPMLGENLTGRPPRKRKPQPSAPQPSQKAWKTAGSVLAVGMSGDAACLALSEDDEEEDPLDIDVDVEEGTQPGTDLALPQPVTGITSLLQGFTSDLQKQMKERENQVQELAKGAVKLSSRRINNLWTTQRAKRGAVLNSFKDRVHTELCELEQDVALLTDMEKTVEATYLKQLTVLREQREKLQNRVKSVSECHEDFRMESEQVEDQSYEAQQRLEVHMKQDMDQLKTKLLLDMQQQQLRRVKDSMQKHFI